MAQCVAKHNDCSVEDKSWLESSTAQAICSQNEIQYLKYWWNKFYLQAFNWELGSVHLPFLLLCFRSSSLIFLSAPCQTRDQGKGMGKWRRGEGGEREREVIFNFLRFFFSCRGRNTSSSRAMFVEVSSRVPELQVCQSVPAFRSAYFWVLSSNEIQ